MAGRELKLNEDAMTLVEVLVALVITAILAVVLLPIFSTTTNWIHDAGKRSIARDYATSITELIRANSADLPVPFKTAGVTEFVATDPLPLNSDNKFIFKLDASDITVDVPTGMRASLRITKYDDSSYYAGAGVTPVITNNLYYVVVTVTWKQGNFSKAFKTSTVIAAR